MAPQDFYNVLNRHEREREREEGRKGEERKEGRKCRRQDVEVESEVLVRPST